MMAFNHKFLTLCLAASLTASYHCAFAAPLPKEDGGTVISYETLQSRYAAGGTISGGVMLEGIIVSNPESLNSGEGLQMDAGNVDHKPIYCTVYMESLDGKHGVKLVTAGIDDNVFSQYDHVKLLLDGAVARVLQNPTRVEIAGVTSAMVKSVVAGTKADVPVKERTIGTLTDDDVYTYVTLKDVEFPIRKGGLTPINERGTLANTVFDIEQGSVAKGWFTKHGLLVRDINGDCTYLWTNDDCPYRRDGSRLPYGSGSLSGVVVHERNPRYEFADGARLSDMETSETLGYVGRYQIRHQSKDDIWGGMSMDFEDGFSALLCEFRYWHYYNGDGGVMSTYTQDGENYNGWLTHTYQSCYTKSREKCFLGNELSHIDTGADMDYLGPVGTKESCYFGANWGNRNGVGIVCDPKHDFIATSKNQKRRFSTSPDGTVEFAGPYADNHAVATGTGGWTGNDTEVKDQINYRNESDRGLGLSWPGANLAFQNEYWWDYDTDRPYAWLLTFSTEGITTSNISLQMTVQNASSAYAPRYWCAEWSLTDSQKPEDDGQWHLIGEYTVPDSQSKSKPVVFSNAGWKPVNFTLPQEILGHSKVYIRLRPTSDLCSDHKGYSGAHLKDKDSKAHSHSTIGYLAIRYNK